MIKGLHHNAYRCRDSEVTRAFYEEFLGLPLVSSQYVPKTDSGLDADFLHTFFRLDDGSCLAFFEVPGRPFEFKKQDTLDLHIALEVERPVLEQMLAKAKAEGHEVRGIVDHDFVDSIYIRDPDGYVIELTAKTARHARAMDPTQNRARTILDEWQARKALPIKE